MSYHTKLKALTPCSIVQRYSAQLMTFFNNLSQPISNFKAFYQLIQQHHANLFNTLPSYQRLVYLINTHQLALHALHHALTKDKRSTYLWIDSTTLPVCKNQRISRHQAISAIATRGKSSLGWFFGCKLHVVMNQWGEIVNTALSNGHVADVNRVEALVDGLIGKLYADRGYISRELKDALAGQGLELMTYHRKNMQAAALSKADEYHLKQRNQIETLFSFLKGHYQLVTSRARSIAGYLAGIYASLLAYQLCHVNKPNIHIIPESP